MSFQLNNPSDAWHWHCASCGAEGVIAGFDEAVKFAEDHSEMWNAKKAHREMPHFVVLQPGERYEDTLARILAEAEQIVNRA